MIWWRRKKRGQMSGPTLDERRRIREAQAAVETAEQAFEQAKRQGAEVSQVSGLLRQLRKENNFGALVERSMLRRHT